MLKIGQKKATLDQPVRFLMDCHRRIEQFLGVIGRVAREARDRALDDEYADALRTALDFFMVSGPRHTEDEEKSLFPRMRAAGDPAIAGALEKIRELEEEHQEIDAKHARIETLARTWVIERRIGPEQADEIAQIASELEQRYARHIRIEDEEIFPLAERLPEDALAELSREMAARRGRA